MQKTAPKRRTFTVQRQLQGKLGPKRFGQLLGQLRKAANGKA